MCWHRSAKLYFFRSVRGYAAQAGAHAVSIQQLFGPDASIRVSIVVRVFRVSRVKLVESSSKANSIHGAKAMLIRTGWHAVAQKNYQNRDWNGSAQQFNYQPGQGVGPGQVPRT